MGSSHELHLREQVSDKAKLLVCPGSRPMAEPGPGQEAGEESPPHPRPGAGLLGTRAGRSRAGSRGSSPPSTPPTTIVLPSPPQGSLCLHTLNRQWLTDARVRGGSSLSVRIEKGEAVSGEGGAHHGSHTIRLHVCPCYVVSAKYLLLGSLC